MLSDTRTNAGVDNISTFRKLSVWQEPGERVLALQTSGNLAVSQAVIHQLSEGVELDGNRATLLSAPSVFEAARVVGAAIREVHRVDSAALAAHDTAFAVAFLLGGQIRGGPPALYHIYTAGNFIAATPDTPFFQIGEHKYGKPILDRAARFTTPLRGAIKLAMISMDSTLRSNLSVGLPIDLFAYRADSFIVGVQHRFGEDDPYFTELRQRWSEALRNAYATLPDPNLGMFASGAETS